MTTWSISPSNQSFAETAGFVTFTVSRSASGTAQTVFISTLQNQGSTNSNDYVGKVNETVTFSVNDLQKTVTLQILDDAVHENTETFGLLLEGPIGTTLASTTFTIIDNDAVAPVVPIASISADQTVNESAGSVTFSVTLDRAPTSQVSVKWSTIAGSASAANGAMVESW